MKAKLTISILLFFSLYINTIGQTVPFEVFAGDKRATLDLLIFKYFKHPENASSKFLFFGRNRITIDYNERLKTNLPQFVSTNAISYTTKVLKGFAPVAVLQIFNRGTFPKAGIQYLKLTPRFSFFGWTVIDLFRDSSIDLFILSRFTPKLTEKVKLYAQIELLANFPTIDHVNLNLIQRTRLGIKLDVVQFGLGFDINEFGYEQFNYSTNTGAFLRYEF
jgi:hypothetical protein